MIDLGSLTGGFIAGFIVGSIASYMLLRSLGKEFINTQETLSNVLDRLNAWLYEFNRSVTELSKAIGKIESLNNRLDKISEKTEMLRHRVNDLASEVLAINNLLSEKFRWRVNINVKTDTGGGE